MTGCTCSCHDEQDHDEDFYEETSEEKAQRGAERKAFRIQAAVDLRGFRALARIGDVGAARALERHMILRRMNLVMRESVKKSIISFNRVLFNMTGLGEVSGRTIRVPVQLTSSFSSAFAKNRR